MSPPGGRLRRVPFIYYCANFDKNQPSIAVVDKSTVRERRAKNGRMQLKLIFIAMIRKQKAGAECSGFFIFSTALVEKWRGGRGSNP
jgi:hypothetical protein